MPGRRPRKPSAVRRTGRPHRGRPVRFSEGGVRTLSDEHPAGEVVEGVEVDERGDGTAAREDGPGIPGYGRPGPGTGTDDEVGEPVTVQLAGGDADTASVVGVAGEEVDDRIVGGRPA